MPVETQIKKQRLVDLFESYSSKQVEENTAEMQQIGANNCHKMQTFIFRISRECSAEHGFEYSATVHDYLKTVILQNLGFQTTTNVDFETK